MHDLLYDNTKVAAYFLWEYTNCENALTLWYCAEDIACYFEQFEVEEADDIWEVVRKGTRDEVYVQFVRQISYRIYNYTQIDLPAYNWLAAERLILNGEWCNAMAYIANAYRSYKDGVMEITGIRSEKIRNYYKSFNNR